MRSYMVFRVYSKKERPNMYKKDRVVFYGWSNNKSVIKAFFEQRDENKYRVVKMDDEDIANFFSEDRRDNDTKIDTLILHSALDHQAIKLFTTANETLQAEKDIQRLFIKACTLSDYPGDYNIDLFINIIERYAEALEIIGFKPPEVEALFTPIEAESNGSMLDDIEDSIEDAYSSLGGYPSYGDTYALKEPPGLMTLKYVYSKMLYSLEAFIKVLREEM